MKLILHGFGSYPILFRHLVQYAKKDWPEAEWSIVLGNSIHLPMVLECLSSDRVLNLDAEWVAELAVFRHGDVDFSTYHGNIYADIESEKRVFKHRSGAEQLRRAGAFYTILKRFFTRLAPDFAVISQIEGIDGKIFAAVARELNIPLIVPYPCRNIGGYFFSEADEEVVPRYALVNDVTKALALNFLKQFRERPTLAANNVVHSGPTLPDFRPPFMHRLVRSVVRLIRYPALFEADTVRVGVLNNFLFVRNAIWGAREWWNRKFEYVTAYESLPEKFVYFPLQYTPESSINAPAPYFVDQLRVVDSIRFALPSDVTLLVKEHPSCLRMRPPSFYRRLVRKAGVVLASPDMDSKELMKRAAVTISVTGTPIFEAFLFGKTSITLGGCLVAKYIGGITPISSLSVRLTDLFGKKLPDDVVIKGLAELISVRNEVVFRSPGEAGEPVLRESNIREIVQALKRHIEAVSVNDAY